MNKKTLPNKKDVKVASSGKFAELTPEGIADRLSERIDELELLLLEQSFWIDELEEEIDLLKEGPNIIIKEIHHYPPAQIIQPAPMPIYWPNITPVPFPTYPITICGPQCGGTTGTFNVHLC